MFDKNTLAYLVTKTTTTDSDGFEAESQAVKKPVWCHLLNGVSGVERASAGQDNIQPSCRITVWASEYSGEAIVEMDGETYGVYRTYPPNSEEMELYLEKKGGVNGTS